MVVEQKLAIGGIGVEGIEMAQAIHATKNGASTRGLKASNEFK